MRFLKLLSFTLMLSILGVLPAFATDVSFAFSSIGTTGWTNSYADHTVTCTDGTVYMNASKQTSNVTTCPVTKGQPVSFVLTDGTKSLSTVSFNCTQWVAKAQTITFKYSTDGGASYSALNPSVTSTNFSISSGTLPTGTNAVQITFSSQTNQVGVASMSYTMASAPSTPTVFVNPASWDFKTVHASDAASKVFKVSGSNLTSGQNLSITVPTGYTVSPNQISVSAATLAEIDVTVSKNTNTVGEYNGNMSISGGGQSSAKTVALKMTIDADPAFTGTFKLFSGDIEEGDYVIYYDGKAMNTTVTSNRLQYLEVTPSDNKITNPDESIIWHIAPISKTTYWSIYNDAEGKYAGGTSTKNQGAMLATIDSYASWAITGTSTYQFENCGRSILTKDADKKWLRNNGTYGFACYASGTGGALTLYKLDDGTPSAPTFSPAGGSFFEAQSVTLGAETGTTIYYTTDGTAPSTSSSVYSAAIPVGTTTTIKAIAVKDDKSSGVASATYTIISVDHAGTAADPYSVADARTVIDAGIGLADKYVRGIVSEIVEPLNTTYHNISYNFSDDGLTTSAQLEAYRGKSYNGGNFTSNDDIQVGDEVVVHGTLNKYGSTYEFDAENQLVKRSAHLAWSGTTEGAYAASLEGGNTFPTLTNSDNVSVSYSSSETSVATINASNGNIDLVGAGSTNITATFTGNDTYFEKSASYTLNVSSTVIKADILFEENGGSAVTDMQAQSNLPSPLPTTTKAGYNFGGWFMDSEFNTSAVAGAAVTSSDPITLYAQWLDPYSVGVALTMINALADNEKTDNVYVIGVVDNHATSLSSTSINYNIKDANASNTLAVYKGKGLKTDLAPTGEDVTSADYVQEGDQVVVYGQLYKYVDKNSNTTPEIAQGSYMFSKVRPAVAVTGIDLTESTAEVEVGSTVTLHASVVPGNATNKTINWTVESGSDKASVQDGVVSGLAVGTAVIRAASDEDATIYAECTVTVTAADPTKHVVTFDATVDTEIFTKDNITMSCLNGALSNGSEYRLYKNSETTFECSAGNITKIEFTGVSGNPVSGFEDPAEGTLETSGNDGVWTGNVASVTFTASGAQVRASLIKVTYKEDTRAESGLAWDPADDIELTVGDAFTAPTLTNPHSLTVSITSDNTDLATVTAGVVALVADATGEATITATFAGNDDYKPATVSYKITVNGGALTDYYEKVTSGAVAEGTYLIVNETNSVAFDGSLETLDATSNTIDVTITNDHKIAVTQATAASTFYIDPTAGTIKSASGKYIGRTAISNGMNTSATEAYTNTISIDNDGNAVIVGSGTTATYLRYNPSSGQTRFRYFTQNQQVIQLYKLANEVIKPAAGLAWEPADDIELTVGETFTAPTLQNPNNIATNEISITSSNTNLATVNNGIVELVADATGTTTIKATFAGNDDYKAAEVSYKIKVNPLSSIVVTPSLKVNFGSVEQGATLPDNQAITVTLTNVAAGTATLGGTNPEAFGIDKTALVEGDNVINISVASTATAGDFKATIVITDNATENPAASKTVNISLKVTEPAAEETPVSTTSKWVAATAADLVDGKEVLITGAKEGTVYAMGEQKTNNRAAVAGTLDEGVFTPGENSMSVTLVDQGNNTFALMTSDGQYLYAASSSANQLKKRTAIGDDNNAIWTVAVDALTANGSNRGVMQFNYSATNQLFSCYASASSSYIAIALYVPQTTPPTPTYTEIRTGLQSGRYYSLCYPKKMTAIKGGTLWSFAGKEADMAYLEQAEAPYAAGQPYFIYAESDKFEAVLEGDATSTAGNNNGLYGTLVDMTNSDLLAAGATYLLKNNELHPLGEAYLSAYKAYVIVENINGGKPAATSGKQVRSMPLHVDTTTGLDELNTSETPTKVIINGQLFIIRGEKMFDATGRLVK